MYGLKRLLEIEKERKERKAEKERKKKEKEEALKAEKRLRRIKRLRHKQNQRYYAKKKKEREPYKRICNISMQYCAFPES